MTEDFEDRECIDRTQRPHIALEVRPPNTRLIETSVHRPLLIIDSTLTIVCAYV